MNFTYIFFCGIAYVELIEDSQIELTEIKIENGCRCRVIIKFDKDMADFLIEIEMSFGI